MREKSPINIGDRLFHSSSRPVTQFNSTTENVIYFGRTAKSVREVGGTGYINTYEVVELLGKEDRYGSRTGWGQHNLWVSLPCELACEALQYADSREV
jgi:hypothetical protein